MIRSIVSQIAFFIVLGLVAVSCSDDLVEGAQAPGGQDDFWSHFDFVIADDADTRVAYDTYKRSTFEAGDEVGIYVVDDSGNLISGQPTNVHYVVRDVTDLNTGERRQVLLPSNPYTSVGKNTDYHYVLYYPYNVNMTLTALKSYTHTIDTDQNASSSTYAPELTAFEHSDLLWCYYTPPTDTQTFEVYFDHAMAQIVVELDESAVYAPDDNAEYTGVYLLNMPMQASNINLLQSWSETFSYATTVPTYDANSTVENPKIHAWKFGTGASGKLQFRAMVPAHTIKYLDEQNVKRPVVRIFSSKNQSKDYYLKSDLILKPGYTYTFTFSKGQTTTDFEVSEDDSWVLDVLDPETGTPVGLLCREYLRYHPGDRPAGYEGYNYTGIPYPNATQPTTKFIDSQAWVFYNLEADGTPDLSEGTVLRFLYDLQFNSGNQTVDAFGDNSAYSPSPHYNNEVGGVFMPKHGYYWITDSKYLVNGYGTELVVSDPTDKRLNEQNYYMHGGTVTWAWDASNNHSYISNFTLPTKGQYASSNTVTVGGGTAQTIGDESGYITNKQAYYFGHIAIGDNGVGVSYQPISADDKYKDIDGNKVGILQPHYLIDRRITASGSVEENRYPLVKIGHNQFWMSKSLRAESFIDGTPITCLNKKTTDGSKPAIYSDGLDWSNIGAGYIYPFSQDFTDQNGHYYDPINDQNEMHPDTLNGDPSFVPAPCYNSLVVNDDRFVPQSTDNKIYYIMPTKLQFYDMAQYFGDYFTAKICTNQIKRRYGTSSYYGSYRLENGTYPQDEEKEGNDLTYDAILYGKTFGGGGTLANYFAANVSGFNLRAIGYYHVYDLGALSNFKSFVGMTQHAVIMLRSDNSTGDVNYITFPVWSPFRSMSNYDELFETVNNYPNNFFAQVRMVMKYRNQLDNGGASTRSILQSFSNTAPSVSQQATDKRHVRIVLE